MILSIQYIHIIALLVMFAKTVIITETDNYNGSGRPNPYRYKNNTNMRLLFRNIAYELPNNFSNNLLHIASITFISISFLTVIQNINI